MLSRSPWVCCVLRFAAAIGLQFLATTAWAQSDADANYWKRSREGWFWGENAPPPTPASPAASASTVARSADPVTNPSPAVVPGRARPSALQKDLDAFEAFKRAFEDSINAATQNPTEENVARFLELYAQARAKASVFSDTAQAVAVRMPWLDETFSGARPTLPSAMKAFDAITMQDRDQLLREMAQSWGLYFFFRRNCAYCHLQAPQLKAFQEKYGFTVFAVSMDGGTLPDFPNAARDNGLAATVADVLKIPQQHFVVPALVLARPSSREVVPIGFGAMNMDQMVERIALAARVRERSTGQGSQTAINALTGQSPQVSAMELAARPLAGAAVNRSGAQP